MSHIPSVGDCEARRCTWPWLIRPVRPSGLVLVDQFLRTTRMRPADFVEAHLLSGHG
jgi:hypothetical protein